MKYPLDVGRRTYELAVERSGLTNPRTWDDLTEKERLDWMEQVVHLAMTSPVFA